MGLQFKKPSILSYGPSIFWLMFLFSSGDFNELGRRTLAVSTLFPALGTGNMPFVGFLLQRSNRGVWVLA